MTYEQIYLAALKAVREMGDDFRNLSWFARNQKQAQTAESQKEAA